MDLRESKYNDCVKHPKNSMFDCYECKTESEVVQLDLCVCLECGLRYNECTCHSDLCYHKNIMTGHTPHSASYCRDCGIEL